MKLCTTVFKCLLYYLSLLYFLMGPILLFCTSSIFLFCFFESWVLKACFPCRSLTDGRQNSAEGNHETIEPGERSRGPSVCRSYLLTLKAAVWNVQGRRKILKYSRKFQQLSVPPTFYKKCQWVLYNCSSLSKIQSESSVFKILVN